MRESEKKDDAALWYSCTCGVLYQPDPPSFDIKDKSYIKKHFNKKEYKDIARYKQRIYSPIIEELTYGRKMLDVGYATHIGMDYLKKRGWITHGIENNKDTVETDRILHDDFETTNKLPNNAFNLVWMSFVLESFRDPLRAIEKVYGILKEEGVLFIATPDIDFLVSKPPDEWGWWKRKEHYIYWSQRALCRELERRGFNIILKQRNYFQRLGYYHDLQIIAQKVYF